MGAGIRGLQYVNKKGEIMVARYSGKHGIWGPILRGLQYLNKMETRYLGAGIEGFTVFEQKWRQGIWGPVLRGLQYLNKNEDTVFGGRY